MTMDVSRCGDARDLFAIAVTCCIAIAWAVIGATILTLPWPQYDPAMHGSVSLEHIGSSGLTWSFRLSNQSPHTIYFRGWPGTEPNTATAPEATTEECYSVKGAEGAVAWILDPPEENYVEVHPRAQRVIAVDNRLTLGGECKLVLTLSNGTDIESNTWTEPGK